MTQEPLIRADLSGADLREGSVRRVNLRGANLREANLQGACLPNTEFNGADLRWANLRGANLKWSTLELANLYEADLQDADLQWARLTGADLEGANLKGTNLKGANLEGAHLLGANLENAKLEGAILTGTILEHEGKKHGQLYSPKGLFWHITPVENEASVMQKGLIPGKTTGLGKIAEREAIVGKLYLLPSHSREEIVELISEGIGLGKMKPGRYLILGVNIPKGVLVHTDPRSVGPLEGVYVKSPIPPEYIIIKEYEDVAA